MSDHAFLPAPASIIAIATSPFSITRPATTISKTARSRSLQRGNATHWPSMRARRTPPTGPENGRPEMSVDADAAFSAIMSYESSGLTASTVSTTCTSLRSVCGNSGRSGRSMMRHARMASVLGRPSRRKNEPGILPAAYIFSSTSTVSGKKS